MPKVLIVTGDAAESLEVMYPYQRLIEEGHQVDIAAPSVKKLQFVVHDFTDGFDTYTEKPGYTWPADIAFADVDPAEYVALVIPGGRAPEYIRNDPDVQRIVRHFMTADRPVAQLCHAPQVLAAAGTLTAAALRPTRRWPLTWWPRALNSSTGQPWSTGRWSRRAPGPTTRPGCASSSRSCAPRRPPEAAGQGHRDSPAQLRPARR